LMFCMLLPWASSASAEEADSKPLTEEQWLKALRGSGSYRTGMENVRRLIDRAYDEGAIRGAKHWEDMRDYYISLGREEGCQRGKPFAEGPVKQCHRTQGPQPKITGKDYDAGLRTVVKLSDQTLYPGVVRRILVVLYDYGYVQGMKHGLRSHNDEIRWRQSYYRSCMARSSGSKGERACADGSKQWADTVIDGLRKRIEAHGLPAGKKN
jgi:hypothetical protein